MTPKSKNEESENQKPQILDSNQNPEVSEVEDPTVTCECCQLLREHATPVVDYLNISKSDVIYDRTLHIYKLESLTTSSKKAPEASQNPGPSSSFSVYPQVAPAKIKRQLDRFEESRLWDLIGLTPKMYEKLPAELKKVTKNRLVFKKCIYRLHNTRHFQVPLVKRGGIRKEDVLKQNYEDDRKLLKKNQAYPCPWDDCPHSFQDPQDMRIHYMFDHESVKLFCCGNRFENYDSFLEHYTQTLNGTGHATWMARECWGCGIRHVDAVTFYQHAERCGCQIHPFALCGVETGSALLQSALPPFVWLIMGNFVSISILREEGKLGLKNLTSDYPIDDQFAHSATPAFISMLGLSIAMFIAAFCQRIAWEISSIRQVFRIKKAYIRKLLLMDISWLESRQSGHVAAMLQESADSIYNGISDHLPMVVFILSYLLVNIGVCLYIQWDVTLFMCLAIPLLIISRILYSKWFANTMEEETKLQNKITNLVNETFNCITTVISFAAQKQKINKFEKLSAEHSKLTEERLRSSVVFDSLTQILLTELIFTGALCYGIWRVADNSPGRLCALAINMLYMCVTSISIGFHMNGATRAKDNAKEICEVLNEQPKIEVELASIDNNIDYVPVTRCKYRRQSMKFMGKGALHFRDIHFSYPSRKETEVLRGISFKVEAGEKIAIVGSSGSGKSTLTALLLRFYDPTKGAILLDGENIKTMCPDDLRGQCSLVSQEPVLFDGTISDNIRYGRLDATQQEINDAARKVGAWKFINSLPDGMQTRVGERGHQLSGGQKQRVAIARAVIRKPIVLIFDEATSALDNIHEEEVNAAIDLASEGLTTITIAHRLSTIKNSDRIIVLHEGKIVEEGVPDELIADANGIFHKMYNDQRLDQLTQQHQQAENIGAGRCDRHPNFRQVRSVPLFPSRSPSRHGHHHHHHHGCRPFPPHHGHHHFPPFWPPCPPPPPFWPPHRRGGHCHHHHHNGHRSFSP